MQHHCEAFDLVAFLQNLNAKVLTDERCVNYVNYGRFLVYIIHVQSLVLDVFVNKLTLKRR